MSLHHTLSTLACVAALFGTTACTKLFGGLRHDLDDQQPSQQFTSGGQWPEHGFLSEDMPLGGDLDRYNAVGHSERGPASDSARPGADTTWVSQADQTAQQRDRLRGIDGENPPSFSNTPNYGAPTRHMYKNGNRATREDFVDDSQNEGSLWASDGQTNYYFTKNRIRGVGDIVTIKMEPGFIKDVGTEIRRTLTADEKDAEIQSAQNRLSQQALTASASATQAGSAGAPAAAANSGGPAPASVSSVTATDKDIDVTKSIDAKDGDPVMAEIVERYPNGNYKIRGTKKIIYKNGTPRLVTLVGIARGQDIGEDDVIQSGKLYEYRLEAYR